MIKYGTERKVHYDYVTFCVLFLYSLLKNLYFRLYWQELERGEDIDSDEDVDTDDERGDD